MDINKLMQQANKMKAEMEKKEKEFGEKTFLYEKQGVKLIMDGRLQIKSLQINEALIDPDDAETLQDMITITINEATEDIQNKKRQIGDSITKGMF